MTDVKKRLVEMGEGVLVEADVLRIVEKIRQYDDNLIVKYADPEKCDYRDAPYAIFELCPDGMERLVFSVWELDDRVIERLYAADTSRHNIQAQIDHTNAIARKAEYQRFQEKRLEEKDLVVTYLKSPKGRWKFKGKSGKLVTLDDDPTKRTV